MDIGTRELPRITRRQGRLRARLLAAAAAATLATSVLAIGAGSASAVAPTVTHYSGTLADGATWIGDVPSNYNGTILLYSHGFGPLVAADEPSYDHGALLTEGYALVGSSYSGPSLWALGSAVRDQFDTLATFEKKVGHHSKVYALGQSMGGLVSSLENQDNRGQLDGVLTSCGLVAGGVNLNSYQLDGEYALTQLLGPSLGIKLVNYASPADATAAATALTTLATANSSTAQGRARIVLAAALLNAPKWVAGNTEPAPTDYAAQADQQVQLLTTTLFGFIVPARYFVELTAGGNTSFTQGVDYQQRLDQTGYLPEVKAAYKAAGLNLNNDLATLTRNADITADPHAIASLSASSMPTGHLTVPQFDIHTIGDQLVPVQQENWFRSQVRSAGDGDLLRQAFTNSVGHCNFQATELIAALHALEHRVNTGHWGNLTKPGPLDLAAAASGLGGAAYTPYTPAILGGARTYPPTRSS